MLVPTTPDDPAAEDNRKAWETLRALDKPFLTAFSDKDAITRGGDRAFQREVPGCAGQPHTTIEGGGHFLQEDRGEAARAGRRELVDGQVASSASTSSRCSTRFAPSRKPACTTPTTRSIASATRSCSPSRRRSTPTAPASTTPRFAPGSPRDLGYVTRQGRRRRRALRRARPDPARAARRRRQMGSCRGLGRRQRGSRSRRSCARSPKRSGLTARVDELVGVFARPAGVNGNPHSVVSIVYLCHAVERHAAAAAPRGARGRLAVDRRRRRRRLAPPPREARPRRARRALAARGRAMRPADEYRSSASPSRSASRSSRANRATAGRSSRRSRPTARSAASGRSRARSPTAPSTRSRRPS